MAIYASRKKKNTKRNKPKTTEVIKEDKLMLNEIPSNIVLQDKKRDWEVPRKLWHFSIGFLVLYLYVTNSSVTMVIRNLLIFLAIVISTDLFRLNYLPFNRLYIRVMGFLMREGEQRSFNGVAYYLAGCITVLYFFPLDIASVAIMLLSWADPVASVVGKTWGRYTIRYPNGKSLAGSLGAFVIGALVTFGFWGYIADEARGPVSWHNGSKIPLPLLALYGGLVSASTEAVDIFNIDDNFLMPVLSGIALWSLLVLFRIGQV